VNVSRQIGKDVLLIAIARTPAGERACLFVRYQRRSVKNRVGVFSMSS